MGVSSAIPIILVPALTGLSSESNPNETIRITAAEASWLGDKHNTTCKLSEIAHTPFDFQAAC